MSSVFIWVLAASLVGADAVAVTTKADVAEVAVGADGKQLMRSEQRNASSAAAAKTVTINLYYETRCPDCVEFINQTLAPLWKNHEMRPHLNITINPYGNAMSLPVANVSAGYKFWHPETTTPEWEYVHICQHGTDECLGNLIQACAISHTTQDQYMELVLCMAGKPDWSVEKASYDCMDQHSVDQDIVKECVNSPAGNKLLGEFGKATQAVPGRQGTPWVMINGVNLDNTTDLMRTVCNHVMVEGTGPTSCKPFVEAPAPAPSHASAQEGGDGDFTVLPVLKKERQLAALSPDKI